MSEAVDDCRAASRTTMRCWGAFSLAHSDSGADLRPRGRKARALIAYLAMHPGAPVSRERLMGLLWGDRAEEQARASLRQAILELKVLANGIALVAIERDSLTLDPAALTSDLGLVYGAAERKAWSELIALLPEPDERLFADLDGLDSGFDDWLAIERARQANALDSLLVDAVVEAQRRGARREARLLAARLRERDPHARLPTEEAPPATGEAPPPVPTPPMKIRPRGLGRAAALALAASLAVGGIIATDMGGLGSPMASARSSALETSGEVNTLYLRARAKMRERNPQASEEARAILDRAVALDGDYAPVLASLAQIMWLTSSQAGPDAPRAREEALALARRALELAPELADAHAALALSLRFEGDEARRHIQRAVELDPSSREYVYWLGHAHSNALDFRRALTAYRRAYELDPTWHLPAQAVTGLAWSMGRRGEAIATVRRFERQASPHEAGLLRAELAFHGGDLSQAAEAYAQSERSTDELGKQAVAVYNRAVALMSVDLVDEARREWAECRWRWAAGRSSALTMPEMFAAHLALRRGNLPATTRLSELNRSQRDHNSRFFVREVTAKLIATGRAAEAIALYDGPDGLLGFSARGPLPEAPQHLIGFAPTVAAALAAVGRQSEARRILLAADRQIKVALLRSRGEVPAEFWAAAAETWAMLGKRENALRALERAVRNGWINTERLAQDLPDDLAEEPAFAGLVGDPRFEALRNEVNGRLDRERNEIRSRA